MAQKSLNKTFNEVKNVLDVTTTPKTLEIYDSGKMIILNLPGGLTLNLPEATKDNIGLLYDIYVKAAFTGTFTLSAGSISDIFTGGLMIVDPDSAGDTNFFQPDTDDDQVIMDADTKGRLIGGEINLIYIAENLIQINGIVIGADTLATPFT